MSSLDDALDALDEEPHGFHLADPAREELVKLRERVWILERRVWILERSFEHWRVRAFMAESRLERLLTDDPVEGR